MYGSVVTLYCCKEVIILAKCMDSVITLSCCIETIILARCMDSVITLPCCTETIIYIHGCYACAPTKTRGWTCCLVDAKDKPTHTHIHVYIYIQSYNHQNKYIGICIILIAMPNTLSRALELC